MVIGSAMPVGVGLSMAHHEQRLFFEWLKGHRPELFKQQRVLEIGSLNINGTVRDYFTDCEYVGVDLGEGPGVDIVAKGEDLTFDTHSFSVCVSTECFEHNPKWWETFANMYRMASLAVIFTCATTGRPEHGTSRSHPESSPFTAELSDYYQNLEEADFRRGNNIDEMFPEYRFIVNELSHDLYFYGLKRGVA
jgi:hypothetical protein